MLFRSVRNTSLDIFNDGLNGLAGGANAVKSVIIRAKNAAGELKSRAASHIPRFRAAENVAAAQTVAVDVDNQREVEEEGVNLQVATPVLVVTDDVAPENVVAAQTVAGAADNQEYEARSVSDDDEFYDCFEEVENDAVNAQIVFKGLDRFFDNLVTGP